MPKLLTEFRIPYPKEAKLKGIQGAVVMELLIDAAGKVREVKLVSGQGSGLDEAALQAAKEFLFSAAKIEDKPVAVKIRFNLTLAPEYSDLTAIYEIKPSSDDEFKTTFFASQDSLSFLLKEPIKTDPSIRGELEHSFSKELKSTLGFDNRYRWANVDLSLPVVYLQGGVSNPLSSGATRSGSVSNKNSTIGVYSRNEWTPTDSNWTFISNLRAEYIGLTQEIILSPRPAVRYSLSPSLVLRSAGGLYIQGPTEQEISSIFGNPNIKAARAWHLTFGAEKDFREDRSDGWIVSSDVFLKWLDQLVIPSTDITIQGGVVQPANFSNDGKGRILGLQSQLKYSDSDGYLALNYTLAQSQRWNSSQPVYPSAYDQTHVLGIVASRELGKNWKLSSRLRYVTGNPFTPITSGIFDSDNDVYLPVRGASYSERLPGFFQFDLRFDKKWIYNKWILSLYIDIQNVTNQNNVEQYQYAYNYTAKAPVAGLPVLPTLGLKGEL